MVKGCRARTVAHGPSGRGADCKSVLAKEAGLLAACVNGVYHIDLMAY